MKSISVGFFIKKEKLNKQGLTPVYVKIRAGKISTSITTNYSVNPKRWTETNQFSTRLGKGSIESVIRSGLDDIKQEFWEAERELRLCNKKITPQSLKLAYTKKSLSEVEKTLGEGFQLMEEYLQRRMAANEYSPNTFKKFKTTKRYTMEFVKFKFKCDDLGLGDLKENFAEEFHFYLKIEKKVKGINSSNKYIRILKAMIQKCVKEGWLKKSPIQDYVVSNVDENIQGLSHDELVSLCNQEFDDPLLDLVKIIFVFSSFSGLAFGDAQKLKMDDIRRVNGKELIIGDRIKTKKEFIVPVFPPTQAIIDKYKDEDFRINDGYVLPRTNITYYNRLLKIVAATVGIKMNLTTHIARHSFGCMCAEYGIPPEVTMKLMGQKDISSTMKYYKVRESRVIRETESLAPLFEKLKIGNPTSDTIAHPVQSVELNAPNSNTK
jgi:integrase